MSRRSSRARTGSISWIWSRMRWSNRGCRCTHPRRIFLRCEDGYSEMETHTTIRAANSEDYQDIYELSACPGVVRETLQLPYVSLDKRRDWLSNMSPDEYMLVAEVDGKVIGSIGIRRGKDRLAHVAGLGMSVHDEYQNRGIGTALMRAILDMTDNWLNIRRVELDVYTDNLRAVHLYKKFGFEIEGVRRDFAFRDGEYVDAYHMARLKE